PAGSAVGPYTTLFRSWHWCWRGSRAHFHIRRWSRGWFFIRCRRWFGFGCLLRLFGRYRRGDRRIAFADFVRWFLIFVLALHQFRSEEHTSELQSRENL